MFQNAKKLTKSLRIASKRGSAPPCFWMRKKRKEPNRSVQTTTMPDSSCCRGLNARREPDAGSYRAVPTTVHWATAPVRSKNFSVRLLPNTLPEAWISTP